MQHDNDKTNGARQSTGVPGLDRLLGGGLIPGTLTVIVGATGIGKTQLALQYANEGAAREGCRGVIFDLSTRGDSQSHGEYTRRMFSWEMEQTDRQSQATGPAVFQTRRQGDYLHVFDGVGRGVSRGNVNVDTWHDWQAILNARLEATIAFLYGAFIGGAQRVVVDGIEPVDRPDESVQLELFQYVYHQIVRKRADWVARDLLRQDYRGNQEQVERHHYDAEKIGCLLMQTSRESMLEELISRPLDQGDLLSGANTVIYMGKLRDGKKISRGLYIAKHRGSVCEESIATYEIDDAGLRMA